jgi:hypothetical protein
MQPIHIIGAVFLSMIFAAVPFVLVFLSGSGRLIGWVILSGTPFATILELLIPDAFWDWAVDDRGGTAAILLFAMSAYLQFVLLFFLLSVWLLRRCSKD